MIVLDSKCAVCMTKNSKYNKHTSYIARRMHFVRNGEKCKIQNIDWCEGDLELAEIATNNIFDNYLTPTMKYIMVRLDN